MIRRLGLSLSPFAAWQRLRAEPGVAFLENRRPEPDTGAYTFLTAHPRTTCIDEVPPVILGRDAPASEGPPAGLPPFRHGWIGYLAYESASLWDPLLATHPGIPGLPRTWWGRYDASLAYRHDDEAWFLSHSDDAPGRDAAARLLDHLAVADVEALSNGDTEATPSTERGSGGIAVNDVDANVTSAVYERCIRRVLEEIGKGDIYQANYTYQMEARLRGSADALYRRLRLENPAPYGAFLQPTDDLTLLSSSPEQFLKVRGRRVQTRPIKGTRPRDLSDPERDRALAAELLGSEKDRAELTMIVDLERNDLGRVCRYGTVRTGTVPELESFETVHHLAATVHGILQEPMTLRDVLSATFPGGSITGAPKIRAMEIIRDLEAAPRFIYTGALGYVDASGDVDLALTIRTLWTHDGRVRLGVGGGIVADSHPEDEWRETHAKAAGMLRALTQRPFDSSLPQGVAGPPVS